MAAKKANRRSKKNAPAKQGAVRKRAAPRASLTAALAEAGWADADEALAEALLECDHVQTASDNTARNAAMAMLAQALSRAARTRGMTRLGVLDASMPFDARAHDLDALGRAPKTVRIAARGVARGAKVLRRPRVIAIGSAKKAAAKTRPAGKKSAKKSPIKKNAGKR